MLFAGLEEALELIEHLAGEHVPEASARRLRRGVLSIAVDDLPKAAAVAAEPLLTTLRGVIATASVSLSLDARVTSRRRSIHAILTAQIIRVEESFARDLRGYGDVDPAAVAAVDPLLERIHADLLALSRLFR